MPGQVPEDGEGLSVGLWRLREGARAHGVQLRHLLQEREPFRVYLDRGFRGRGHKPGDRFGPAPREAEPSPEEFGPGARLGQDGHYEVIHLLGQGGMGRVFLARDVKLGRLVAIKVLRDPLGEGTERFLQGSPRHGPAQPREHRDHLRGQRAPGDTLHGARVREGPDPEPVAARAPEQDGRERRRGCRPSGPWSSCGRW